MGLKLDNFNCQLLYGSIVAKTSKENREELNIASNNITLRLSIEETDDFQTWTNRDEINLPLEASKRSFLFLTRSLGFDSMEGIDDRRWPAEGWSLSGIEIPQLWLVQALRHGHVKPLVFPKGVIK